MLIKLEELDRRLQAIERVVQNQSLVTMTQQLSALERRVAELQGSTEEIQYNASTTYERQRELYADLDARIQGLESALQARGNVNVLDGGPLPPGQLPVPGGSDRDNYQVAFELLKEILKLQHRARLFERPDFFAEHHGAGGTRLGMERTFDAAHRLHSPHLDDAENWRVYERCNNPSGHGHTYLVEATLAAPYDERSGTVGDFLALRDGLDAALAWPRRRPQVRPLAPAVRCGRGSEQ